MEEEALLMPVACRSRIGRQRIRGARVGILGGKTFVLSGKPTGV